MPFCVPVSRNWIDGCDIPSSTESSTFARQRHIISIGFILEKRVAILIYVDFDNAIPEEVITVVLSSSV